MGTLGIPDAVLSHARAIGGSIGGRIAELGGRDVRVDADDIVTGRAALLGLVPRGALSAGGASRLLETRDGWCAVTLSRADDVDAVPALLELPDTVADAWSSLTLAAADRRATDLVARARLLGMPAAVLGEISPAEPNTGRHSESANRRLGECLVADLSSMWAGPLVGRILAAAGATVVKIETAGRPDGTRAGHRGFFDFVNSEKLCYATELGSTQLRELIDAADIVIEGSRPAALARHGVSPEHIRGGRGRIWLRITGYGTDGDCADWVAFGDDAAVAGGLVAYRNGAPAFCGDAIADPLSGLTAAKAVLDALADGGGTLIEVSMAAVAATYAALPAATPDHTPPRMPELPCRPAHDLGADNAYVDRLVAARRVAC